MPGLHLFGRRWAFSSDDLPALAFFGVLFHGAWLLLIIVFSVYAHSVYEPGKCDEAVQLATFMACLLLSLLVSTICDVLILWYGLKGTIFQSSSRRCVNLVMYVLTFNFLLKICITAYGTYLVFIQQSKCLQKTAKLDEVMQAVIISTWVIIILYILISIISYQAFPKNSVLQWKRRIRFVNCCCCGSFDQMESEPLARMALVFEKFFKPMDFSPTDTLVAMYLAAKLQIFSRNRSCTEPSSTVLSSASLFTANLPFSITERSANAHSLNSPYAHASIGGTGIEMRQTKLAPVLENDELSILEEGGLNSSSEFAEQVNQEPVFIKEDEEILVSVPGHRRTNAFDFSQVDFSVPFPLDPDSPGQSGSFNNAALTPPDSDPRSPQTLDSEGSDSGDSVETTLTWEDDYPGPYLIQTEDGGINNCFLTTLPSVDYETLERMHLYHRYALASYGALLYLASGKRFLEQCGRCCGLCLRAGPPSLAWSIISRESNEQHPPRSPSLINRLNEEAVLLYGFQERDILFRSHQDDFACQLPYFVAMDESDKAIVVAVRGTWSWVDIVTDFHIHPEALSEEERNGVLELLQEVYGPGHGKVETLAHLSVHSGMLRSARGLIRSLQTAGLLQFLEQGNLSQLASNRSFASIPDISDWKFVMTGHSLGAGVVSLATLLLKSQYRHKLIECFAISPPACVMSEELAHAIAPFCLSLVHGKDIVPRISLLTAERLRDQMVRAATLCKKSKMRVLLSCLSRKKWTKRGLFCNPHELDDEPLEAMKQYRSAVKKEEEQDGLDTARRFIPPGKIVFLRPRHRTHPLTDGGADLRRFEAVWISGKDLIQEGIILSLFMIKDHFPYFSIESLREVLDERGSY